MKMEEDSLARKANRNKFYPNFHLSSEKFLHCRKLFFFCRIIINLATCNAPGQNGAEFWSKIVRHLFFLSAICFLLLK